MKITLITLTIICAGVAWLAIAVTEAVTRVEMTAAARDKREAFTAEKRSQLRHGELKLQRSQANVTTVVKSTH